MIDDQLDVVGLQFRSSKAISAGRFVFLKFEFHDLVYFKLLNLY